MNKKIVYINVMRNMSVSCDCEGVEAEPVVTPNVGICASTDLLAVDQACVDMIYAMQPHQRHAMVERIESRHGLRQLSYMKELGMGNTKYKLIDIDNDDAEITDQNMRLIAKEIIREKVLLLTQDEVPHSCAIVIDKFEENEKIVKIKATIHVEHDSQKGIIIGILYKL